MPAQVKEEDKRWAAKKYRKFIFFNQEDCFSVMVFGDEIPRPDSAEEGRHMSNLPSCQVNITPKKEKQPAKNA